MNLVLVRACSNSCPYCFEAKERQHGKIRDIPMESVLKMARWARGANLRALSLLGGEPFLHPNLKEIIRVFRLSNPEMSLRVLTGGVFNIALLDDLSPDDVGLVFNVNEPRDYQNPKHFNKVLKNIETAIQRGFNVILGFNVWRLDFDPRFMPKLADSFGRSSFSWTVANPQRQAISNVVMPDQYENLADRCLAMLEEAARLGIEARLDCPLPLCFFKDSQLGWVRLHHPEIASSMGHCEPVLDVTPELDVIRCFALSEVSRVKLTDFQNEDQLSEWFTRHVDHHLLNGGCFQKCIECPHFQKGRCYGGCLACHPGMVDTQVQPSIELFKNIQQALTDENPSLALHLFEQANYWIKTDKSMLIAASAALSLGQTQTALRLATESCNITEDTSLLKQGRELIKDIHRLKGITSERVC